jgi:carboxylesterase type B
MLAHSTVLLLASSLALASSGRVAPVGTSINGTYSGKYNSPHHQDAFLGIPYAQPPLGDLRFRRPVSMNTTWDGSRDSKEFGSTCYQSSNRTDMSEDCLTLNGTVA